MSHSFHPPVSEAGLADGCADCAEIAERPFARLDDWNLHDLVARTVENRFGDGLPARSDAEARAMAEVMNALERVGRLFEAAPKVVEGYLATRWNVRITTEGRT